jgi:amidase
MSDLLLQPAHVLLARLDEGSLTAADLLEATLARVDTLNPALNAVVRTDRDGARRAAAESDARRKAGGALPLDGLPITIKDGFDVAGLVTASGAPVYKDRVAATDAAAVARLRAAGAVIYGKTNVPFFCGDFQSYNPVYGTTNNPWDAGRSPGGSSGGAAAAVATGMSAFELGSDLGGSIRWPAQATGVFGLKTTWDLVSTWGHVPPPPERRTERNGELTVAGPLARSARDLGLVLDVIAGPRDPALPAAPFAPARKMSARGLRVALWIDESMAPVDASVAAAVRKAADALASEGAIISETARPPFSLAEAYEIYAVLNHAIVASGLPDKVRDKIVAAAAGLPKADLSHRALQARGARMAADDFADISARRKAVVAGWAAFFDKVDVLLCPPAPVGAIPHDHNPDIHARRLQVNGREIPYLDFLVWSSLATGGNLPAAVAPILRAADGLPRGVQIVAGAFEDRTAVAVAQMLEDLCGGFVAPPLPNA